MPVTGARLAALVQEADGLLERLELQSITRFNAALNAAALDLEREITKLARAAQGEIKNVSLALREARARMILEQVRALLNLTGKPLFRGQFERLTLETSVAGIDAALAVIAEIEGAAFVPATATVPVDAAVRALNASARLQAHGVVFAQAVEQIVVSGIVRGSSVSGMARAIREQTGVLQSRAVAIARTESITAFDEANRAQIQAFDVPYVIRVATQDERVCPYCAARAGRAYPVADAPAVLHVNDRCRNIPMRRSWIEDGLLDTAWLKQHREDVHRRVLERGESPNYGAAPFEKANKADAPKAVWDASKGWLR